MVVDALSVVWLPAVVRAGGHSMAVEQGGVCFDKIAAKWHALAQRRLAHVRELERSGRWKRLYSDEQFRSYLRETERVADLWARLAAGQFAVPPEGSSMLPAA